jgi:predicted nucleic acid-binding protein
LSQHEEFVCNTTPVRHFAVVAAFDVLVDTLGGVVRLPREVFDPEELDDQIPALRSEIVRAERHFLTRSREEDALETYSRLRNLHARQDIEVLDLDVEELGVKAELQRAEMSRALGLVAPLGEGEAAAIAIAECRNMVAVIDDAGARRALLHRVPGATVITSRDVLRRSLAGGKLTTSEAEAIYVRMVRHGYRGPAALFDQ